MDINEILEDEQIIMMRLASTTSRSDAREQHTKLGRIAGKLSLFAYPHRPYVAQKRHMVAPGINGATPTRPSLRLGHDKGVC